MSTSPEQGAPGLALSTSQDAQSSKGSTSKHPASPSLPRKLKDDSVSRQHEESEIHTRSEHTTIDRPPFQPFFTIISDATTSMTYHPRRVHYTFSDDDTELLTAACLQAVDPEDNYSGAQPSESNGQQKQPSSQIKHTRENRILLVDMDESGSKIVKAHSLTPNWQILCTTLTPAPTGEAPATEDATENNNMMLRIEGTDGYEEPATKIKGLGIQDGTMVGEEEFAVLMHDFDERMRILRTVVEAGGHSQGQDVEGEHGAEQVEQL